MSSHLSGTVFDMPQLVRNQHGRAERSEGEPEGWAPCRTLYKSGRACACKCVDGLGYHRAKHSLDADGRCCFCSRQVSP